MYPWSHRSISDHINVSVIPSFYLRSYQCIRDPIVLSQTISMYQTWAANCLSYYVRSCDECQVVPMFLSGPLKYAACPRALAVMMYLLSDGVRYGMVWYGIVCKHLLVLASGGCRVIASALPPVCARRDRISSGCFSTTWYVRLWARPALIDSPPSAAHQRQLQLYTGPPAATAALHRPAIPTSRLMGRPASINNIYRPHGSAYDNVCKIYMAIFNFYLM